MTLRSQSPFLLKKKCPWVQRKLKASRHVEAPGSTPGESIIISECVKSSYKSKILRNFLFDSMDLLVTEPEV